MYITYSILIIIIPENNINEERLFFTTIRENINPWLFMHNTLYEIDDTNRIFWFLRTRRKENVNIFDFTGLKWIRTFPILS